MPTCTTFPSLRMLAQEEQSFEEMKEGSPRK